MSSLPGVSTWRPTPPCDHRTRTPKLCLICRALSALRKEATWRDIRPMLDARSRVRAGRTMATRLEAARRALDARLGLDPCQEASDGR